MNPEKRKVTPLAASELNVEIEEKNVIDISDRVRAIFNCTDPRQKTELARELRNDDELYDSPALTLTLDYTTLEDAEWVKGWIEHGGRQDQERSATIRATEKQHQEAPNVFGSGVKWISIQG